MGAEQDAPGNSRHAAQLTDLRDSNIIVAGDAVLRRLCLSFRVGRHYEHSNKTHHNHHKS
jgi:hypothetical protein